MADPPRRRSSTLKPPKQPPARLDLPPAPHPERPGAKSTPFSAGATPRPTSPTPTQATQHAGIRAHIAHLLPRHAVFTVTLTLHQLHNVPLVHGEFGLRWKINGVTSHSGNSLLDRVRARKAQGRLGERSRSSAAAEPPTPISRGSDTDNASLLDAASASDARSVANSSSTHSRSTDHVNGAHPVPIPAVVVSVNHPPSSPSSLARSVSAASVASMSSASSRSLASSHLHARPHDPPGYLSADWSQSRLAQPPGRLQHSPAKGITSFVKLRDHNVVWEQTLNLVIQMSIGRDSGELGDCLAKLVVMQRVIPGDPDAPRNPCLGVVCLNLAQYADVGVVTRRYLLRQSKTNATLKLSVHVEHTAGELAYVAPPLPKDEILSGVAGFLQSSDIYRTRPRASDLYTDASSSSLSEANTASGSDTSSIVSGSGASNGGHVHSKGHGRVNKQRRPFDISRLPTINDPRGTERLIEALFNPVPVTQASKLTPFTYLVEVDAEGDGDGEYSAHRAGRTATAHEDQTLAHGEGDDNSSLDEGEKADGTASEYHSLRSHPSFQGSLRSMCSGRPLASKAGLKPDDAVEDTAAGTGAIERRTWWQKVLSPPAAA